MKFVYSPAYDLAPYTYKVKLYLHVMNQDEYQWVTQNVTSDTLLTEFEVINIAAQYASEMSAMWKEGSGGVVADINFEESYVEVVYTSEEGAA